MAKIIRSPQVSAENWSSRSAAASAFYASQAQSATWKQYAGSGQAETNFAAAMQAAIAAKSRMNGVNASSDEAWKGGIAAVGASRFGQGVNASKPRMEAAMGKLIPAINDIRSKLPVRGPRGSAANQQRAVSFMSQLTAKRGTLGAKGVSRVAA